MVWRDLGLNPGLQDHWRALYLLGQSHCWRDEGVHTFPKGISPKMKPVARLEFELAYYDVVVLNVSCHAMGTPLRCFVMLTISKNRLELPKCAPWYKNTAKSLTELSNYEEDSANQFGHVYRIPQCEIVNMFHWFVSSWLFSMYDFRWGTNIILSEDFNWLFKLYDILWWILFISRRCLLTIKFRSYWICLKIEFYELFDFSHLSNTWFGFLGFMAYQPL